MTNSPKTGVLNRGKFPLQGNFGISEREFYGGKFRGDKNMPKSRGTVDLTVWYQTGTVKIVFFI